MKEEEIARQEGNWAQNCVNSSNVNFRWHAGQGNGSRISERGNQIIKVKIKTVFKKEIIDHLSINLTQSVIRNFQLALKSNDQQELEKTLRTYLIQCVSNFDTAGENFYHGMMLGLLAIMSDEYQITSNRESGEGRFDIQLMPVRDDKPGILMEFKAAKNADEDQLAKLADEAIELILKKQYTTEMQAKGISEIQLYGIAFSKKKATVRIQNM